MKTTINNTIHLSARSAMVQALLTEKAGLLGDVRRKVSGNVLTFEDSQGNCVNLARLPYGFYLWTMTFMFWGYGKEKKCQLVQRRYEWRIE